MKQVPHSILKMKAFAYRIPLPYMCDVLHELLYRHSHSLAEYFRSYISPSAKTVSFDYRKRRCVGRARWAVPDTVCEGQ